MGDETIVRLIDEMKDGKTLSSRARKRRKLRELSQSTDDKKPKKTEVEGNFFQLVVFGIFFCPVSLPCLEMWFG